MSVDNTAALIAQVDAGITAARVQISDYIVPKLTAAGWNISIARGYISNLSDGLRESADSYLRAAETDVWGSAGYLATVTAARLTEAKTALGATLAEHIKAVQAAADGARVDIEALVSTISDNTRGLLSTAVGRIVDNLYNIQDTITRLTIGGFTLMRDALGDLLDRIPAAVWKYLGDWLNEEIK